MPAGSFQKLSPGLAGPESSSVLTRSPAWWPLPSSPTPEAQTPACPQGQPLAAAKRGEQTSGSVLALPLPAVQVQGTVPLGWVLGPEAPRVLPSFSFPSPYAPPPLLPAPSSSSPFLPLFFSHFPLPLGKTPSLLPIP